MRASNPTTTPRSAASGTVASRWSARPRLVRRMTARFIRLVPGPDDAAQSGRAELEARADAFAQFRPRRRRRAVPAARRGSPRRGPLRSRRGTLAQVVGGGLGVSCSLMATTLERPRPRPRAGGRAGGHRRRRAGRSTASTMRRSRSARRRAPRARRCVAGRCRRVAEGLLGTSDHPGGWASACRAGNSHAPFRGSATRGGVGHRRRGDRGASARRRRPRRPRAPGPVAVPDPGRGRPGGRRATSTRTAGAGSATGPCRDRRSTPGTR